MKIGQKINLFEDNRQSYFYKIQNLYIFKMSLFYANNQKNLYPEIGQQKKNDPVPKDKKPQGSQGDIFQNHKQQTNLRNSVFLKQNQPVHDPNASKEEGCCAKCCACFSLNYYKDYFKVTNKDVTRRIMCNIKFWSGGFFEPLNQQYDLYGPFWLYTTMVFVCSAVHNVLIYSSNAQNFQYDFSIIGVGIGIFYVMGLLVSALIGLFFGCLGLASKTSQIVCIYGYSMSTYIICVLLCIMNMTLTTWLFLIYGACTKIAFLLKNIFQKLEVPSQKKLFVVILVIVEAVIQLMAIKISLIITGGPSSGALSHFSAIIPGNQSEMHFRTFDPLHH